MSNQTSGSAIVSPQYEDPGAGSVPTGAGPATEATYSVVVNISGQYSIWPAGSPIPAGWEAVGELGPKDRCLAHIESIWTDMRPRRAQNP